MKNKHLKIYCPMNSQEELKEFFKSYDQNNKAHVRMLEMLVESARTSREIAELEKVSGMKLSNRCDNLENSSLVDEGAGVFDYSTGHLFDMNAGLNDEGREDIKRVNVDEETSHKGSEVGLDEEVGYIPGLGGFEEGEKPMVINEPDAAVVQPKRSKRNINKQLLETVFYKSVFKPVKASETTDSCTPREPTYLFLPLQCKLCGLRYVSTETEQFGTHIEEHRRKARALEERDVLRREFFTTKNVEVLERLRLNVEGTAEIIPWSRECPNCSVCGDPIRKVWRDDIEKWALESGVMVNLNEFVHRDCVL